MTPEQIDEALALFDRVNVEPPLHQMNDRLAWEDMRAEFTCRMRDYDGPWERLGSVLHFCLPVGWAWRHADGVMAAFPSGSDSAIFVTADHPDLAMVRAISAALDMGEARLRVHHVHAI